MNHEDLQAIADQIGPRTSAIMAAVNQTATGEPRCIEQEHWVAWFDEWAGTQTMNDPTKTPVRREQNKLRTAAPKDLTGVYGAADTPWALPPPDIDGVTK